jgi:hypothetical protein
MDVCGIDRLGAPYRTTILFFFDEGGQLRMMEPVFWSRMRVATDSLASPDQSQATQGC